MIGYDVQGAFRAPFDVRLFDHLASARPDPVCAWAAGCEVGRRHEVPHLVGMSSRRRGSASGRKPVGGSGAAIAPSGAFGQCNYPSALQLKRIDDGAGDRFRGHGYPRIDPFGDSGHPIAKPGRVLGPGWARHGLSERRKCGSWAGAESSHHDHQPSRSAARRAASAERRPRTPPTGKVLDPSPTGGVIGSGQGFYRVSGQNFGPVSPDTRAPATSISWSATLVRGCWPTQSDGVSPVVHNRHDRLPRTGSGPG